MDYGDIVRSSIIRAKPVGMKEYTLPDCLREHQRHAVSFALEAGRSALFLDTGLGKTLCAFAWADNVARETGLPVLMLAPLGVVHQHAREAEKFGFQAKVCQSQADVTPGLNITNYDKLHHFDSGKFGGLILDESSIIKNFSGIVTRRLMEFGSVIPYRLCLSATPAPNDHMELGQHCQFLGVMSSSEMLARWFLADQSEMGRYRLKRHAVDDFWSWVASWARCAEKPSDLGGDDTGYNLPTLHVIPHIVKTDIQHGAPEGMLFRVPDNSATSIHREKRLTAADRARKIAELIRAEPDEPWLIWVETDYDADAMRAELPGITEVNGKMKPDEKERGLAAFSDGSAKILLTKPSIAGWGLNWQHCARVAFVGLSFSYEGFYQAVRRCWRYGQTREVFAHVACAETEASIWATVERKRGDHETMKKAMREAMERAIKVRSTKNDYKPNATVQLPDWLKGIAA